MQSFSERRFGLDDSVKSRLRHCLVATRSRWITNYSGLPKNLQLIKVKYVELVNFTLILMNFYEQWLI
jgi:hypothetical protein